MDTTYWISLIVGGVFVLLSLIGGGDSDLDTEIDSDLDADVSSESDIGTGWVDLFSVRTIFLFAAFFGLCGVLLPLAGLGEGARLLASLTLGLVIGIGGNYLIKRVGYAHISSEVTSAELKGRTAKVVIPFDSLDVGKIVLVTKGQRIQFKARSFEAIEDVYAEGEEVIIVRMQGAVAEVLKAQ
ncbi:MAG: hypothetical protein OXE92_03930 [Bacteroidetes bacterium]|nr:hypothetical protein [Bacteroidota bacterium]MCY4204858.1 hypothetical protein [Bacteroidota bacterium]